MTLGTDSWSADENDYVIQHADKKEVEQAKVKLFRLLFSLYSNIYPDILVSRTFSICKVFYSLLPICF